MGVPTTAAVLPGAAVNVVLKADQPSGRLTKGVVKDLLTRGNHPRGIKVRLVDGQIGRVQSLGQAVPVVNSDGPALVKHNPPTLETLSDNPHVHRPPNSARVRPVHFQDDYRNDLAPAEERSLEDYVTIKPAKSKQKRSKRSGALNPVEVSDSSHEPQALLQSEFPHIDSALIAAILGDSSGLDDARKTLVAIAS